MAGNRGRRSQRVVVTPAVAVLLAASLGLAAHPTAAAPPEDLPGRPTPTPTASATPSVAASESPPSEPSPAPRLASSPPPDGSSEPDPERIAPQRVGDLLRDKQPKLDSQLAALARIERERGVAAALQEAGARGLSAVDSRIRVVVESTAADPARARAAANAAGGQVEAEYQHLLQVLLPPAAFGTLAEKPEVRYIRPPFFAKPAATLSQGVASSNASAWHTGTPPFLGAGVKVAVIDFGFAGYAAAQASGDLPLSLTRIDYCAGGFSSSTNHGTAVAEIVYDMAPGAQLYLICILSEVSLGQAKDDAKANGIQIVNHSVGWFNTSRGDGSGGAGTPDDIVRDARANGILWVNAAGNEAQLHWSGDFSDPDANDSHNFGTFDELNSIFLPTDAQTCVFLKWDAWPATTQDFDLWLWSETDGFIEALSVNDQSGTPGGLRPTESLCYTNLTGSAQYFGIQITKFDATTSPRFDLFASYTPEYAVGAGSVLEPASSPNALAVGALCWSNNALEPYSSLGPNMSGLTKPDIVAWDWVSTATSGSSTGCSAGGFQGTSASAPHIAGAAALVKQLSPGADPSAIQSFIDCRVVDLGPSGRDNAYGSGFLWLSTPPPSAPPSEGVTWLLNQPQRVVDTRFASGYQGAGAPLQGFSSPSCFTIGGRAGVPQDAVGILANITTANPPSNAHLTIWPDGGAMPATSNMNYMTWQSALANMAIIRLGTGGAVDVVGANGANAIIDIVGFIMPAASTETPPGATLAGQMFLLTKPERVVDTRPDSGYQGAGTPMAGFTTPRCYDVITGVPDMTTDASGIVANVTTTNHTPYAAHLTIWPNGESQPATSNLNYVPQEYAQANMAIIRVGTEFKVCVVGAPGVNVIIDVVGAYQAGAFTQTHLLAGPVRLVDTRPNSGFQGAGTPMAGFDTPLCYDIAGQSGVPTNARGVLANVTTTTHPAGGAHLTIWPDGEQKPATSNMNYVNDEDALANMAIVRLGGAEGRVCVVGAPNLNVIIDVVGYTVSTF